MLKQAKDIRSGKDSKSAPLKKRFWSDVHVKEVDGTLHLETPPKLENANNTRKTANPPRQATVAASSDQGNHVSASFEAEPRLSPRS